MRELRLSSGDSESTGKGILSAVMSRITGNADKASDAPAASNGTEAKQGEDSQKKSVPEIQASLPHVATRHVPTMPTADDSQPMPLYEQACVKAEHVTFAVFIFFHACFVLTGLSISCKQHPLFGCCSTLQAWVVCQIHRLSNVRMRNKE